MKTMATLCAVLTVTLLGASAAAGQAGSASILSLVSPLDTVARITTELQVAASGDRVVVVYQGHVGTAPLGLFSATSSGGPWQRGTLERPEGSSLPSLRALLAEGQKSLLMGSQGGHLLLWQGNGNTWTGPTEIAQSVTGVTASGLVRTPAGLAAVARSTIFNWYQQQGSQWPLSKLKFTVGQHSYPPAYVDLAGTTELFGMHRGVPIVATLPPGADGTQEANWQIQPPGSREGWTSAAPAAATELRAVLDWPHRRVFVVWSKAEQPTLAWAPVGATSAAQWQQAQVPVLPRAVRTEYQLVSNGHGAVGLLLYQQAGGDPSLTFHWLGASGLGPAIPILRPGTQTEASVFQSLDGEGMNCCLDDRGVAHVVIVGQKRGEMPANIRRVFYSAVTGGPTAISGGGTTTTGTTGGGTTGGGTTAGGTETGPDPDFVARILVPAADDEPLRVSPLSSWESLSLSPRIEITNQGAQYFGDLSFAVNVDGAQLRICLRDESGHRTALFTRGQKRVFYLPRFVYSYRYEPTAQPPAPLTYDYAPRDTKIMLRTGLGRKRLTVQVDPDNAIREANEDNNATEVGYVVADGHDVKDRQKVGAKTVYGLNDVGLLTTPILRSNTRLLHTGYVQRPTQLDLLVGNPRLAGVFLNTLVTVKLDGQPLFQQTVPVLERTPNLRSVYLGRAIIYDPVPPKPDVSGVQLHVPVDLTSVAEGDHTLQIAVDPQDVFADRMRDNNAATLRFHVRPPGGLLRIRVTDYTAPHPPVAHAAVVLKDMWGGFTDAQGAIEIADVPAGSYDAKSLYADRDEPEPRFFTGYAAPFTVQNRQTLDLAIQCERALNVVGDVRVAGTGQFLDDESIEAFLYDTDGLYCPGGATGHRYRIPDVLPGRHRVICGAYGFQTKETTAQLTRTSHATDDCVLDLALVDGPRAAVTGKVVDLTTNRPLAGATVWLQGAPRAVGTGTDGVFRLERVAANQDYPVWAQADDHTTEGTSTGLLTAGQTKDVGIIKLGQISPKFTSIDFDATTWAICEQTAAAGDIPAIKVDTKFGAFQGALGLMYHATAGQTDITLDNLIIWLQGGDFIQGGVSAEVGIEKLTGVEMDTLKVGIMKDVLDGVGKGFKVLDGVNKLAAWLQGPVDPSMMHRNNKIVATYTTHTQTKYEQDPLIDIPLSTDVPIGVGFRGGGDTVVRVDKIEITDAMRRTKVLTPEWYSPGFCVFRLNQVMDVNTVEVKLYVAVLNSRLQSGVLGNASRNLIHWKPTQRNWLRISGFQYD